jgi:hypothetical protein
MLHTCSSWRELALRVPATSSLAQQGLALLLKV